MSRKKGIFLTLFAVAVLMGLTVGIVSAEPVTQDIAYQGKLTDAAGNPLTGIYPVTFNLYEGSSGGTTLASDTHNVQVSEGLFTSQITFDSTLFDGRALWLGITVGSDAEMTPRQEIRPVPFALSLRPGAWIISSDFSSTLNLLSNGGPTLNVSASGDESAAVYASSTGEYYGYGVYASTSGSYSEGVYASTTGPVSTGVYAETYGSSSPGLVASTSGIWSKGVSASTSNTSSDGVYTSTSGTNSRGLAAYTSGDGSNGVYTSTSGSNSDGVFISTSGASSHGVTASTSNTSSPGVTVWTYGASSPGVGATTKGPSSSGIVARTEGTDSMGVWVDTRGPHSYGVFISTTNTSSHGLTADTTGADSNGVWASTHGPSSHGILTKTSAEDSNGVYAESNQSIGVYAATNRADNKWGLYTPNYIYAMGAQYPAADVAEFMPVVENATPGTVLIIGEDGRLAPATSAYDTRVAGIISTDPGIFLGTKDDGNKGEALIAIAGRVPCRVDAGYGAIHPGDILTTSPTPGHAMKAVPVNIGGMEIFKPGTVVGKSLGSLERGTGTIDVLVTLQ